MAKIADNPFDGEANRLLEDPKYTEQMARDEVVQKSLRNGDTRALAHWLEKGYCPGTEVSQLLSRMLQPERDDADDPTKTYKYPPVDVPYKLEAKRRDGRRGARRDPVAAERNRALCEYYQNELGIAGPGSSDSVIKKMVEDLPGTTESMIREALKKRSPKSD